MPDSKMMERPDPSQRVLQKFRFWNGFYYYVKLSRPITPSSFSALKKVFFETEVYGFQVNFDLMMRLLL
jgi:hypothetical protein